MRGETGKIKRKRSRYEEGTEMRGKKGDMRGEEEQEWRMKGKETMYKRRKKNSNYH